MFRKLISKLFVPQKSARNRKSRYYLSAQINDKVGPIDRSIVYEEPMNEFLKDGNHGEISGGGTGQESTGEIAYCDIEIELGYNKSDDTILQKIM